MLTQSGYDVLFIGTIPLFASPYFSLGLRKVLMDSAKKTKMKLVENVASYVQRGLTLIKRHMIYRPFNKIIMTFNLNGDNLFFVARKR